MKLESFGLVRHFFRAQIALSMALSPLPAFASSTDMERNLASVRQERMRNPVRENTVRIAGVLEINEGAMQITDQSSGKTYRINTNTRISEIYSKGNRKIRIEGTLTGNDTVEAHTVHTL